MPAWNLGYRLTPAAWGHGFATELGAAAIEAANGTRPELPVVARALSHNTGSWRVLERLGLTLAWEGPVTQPNLPTSAMDLRVYADRPINEKLVGQIAALG